MNSEHDYKAALEWFDTMDETIGFDVYCSEEPTNVLSSIRAALELAIQHEEDIARGRQISLDYFNAKEELNEQ